MSRRILILITAILLAATCGCKKLMPGVAKSNAGTDGVSVSGGDTPSLVPAGSSLSMELVHGNLDRSAVRLVQLLKSVQDDASARAAAPKLGPSGVAFGEAMKQWKATVAALELGGRKREVDQFMEKLAKQVAEKGDDRRPQDDLEPEIERVALGPQGPLLRAEINKVLDAMLDGATIRQRAKWQQWINDKRLRG